MPVDPVRDAAIDVLLRVFERGAYLDLALDKTLRRKTELSERGRRFLTQLVYGTVRHKWLCEYVLRTLLTKPFEELPAPIAAILRMAVFQALFCHQVTFPAMVHTSVELAKRRGHAGLGRLVNAVLRKAPSRLEDIELPPSDTVEYLAIRYSTPQWLVEDWIAESGHDVAEQMCAACCEQAPTTLRVNLTKTTPDALAGHLAQVGCSAAKLTPVPEELTVSGGSPLRSKFFQSGHFTIQDSASMLPAHLLAPLPEEWILDLCAAPGSKTTHLAALAEDKAHVIAMDLNPRRLDSVFDNVERLNLNSIHVLCADGLRPPFADGFDKVLLDAPCTGLGTLRRNPDLKWRAQPCDAQRLAALQRDLLRSAVGLCKNDGVVVYSVCTITKAETVELVHAVADEMHLRFEDGPEWLEPWKIANGQYRTLPQSGGWDGFFLTRLRKVS